MQVSFNTTSAADISTSVLAIALPSDSIEKIAETLGSEWLDAIKQDDFKGKPGTLLSYPSLGKAKASRIFICGAGSGSGDDLRRAAGAAGVSARKHGYTSVAFLTENLDAQSTKEIVSGFCAGNYVYEKYKSAENKKDKASELILCGQDFSNAAEKSLAYAAGRELARDLVNAPAADIYPETLADAARALAGQGITVEVWDEKKVLEAGMAGIPAVGQGSSKTPRFIHLHYKPKGTPEKKIALVGKGVTFDAGGLSLKPSAGMQTMRCDMGGSATVLGIFKVIRETQPNVEVHGLIGAAENMCAANSYKLGDILTMLNGKTVEIHNTDAEGRLVMADCLVYGSRLGVDFMIDLATLTGANIVALGEHYSGLYTNEDDLAQNLIGCAKKSGEHIWRMPLDDMYKAHLKAEWGEIKNVGGRAAGSITAALFLSEFVGETPWAHIDIAGPAFCDKKFRHFAPGGTGVMVETLAHLLNC